MFKVLILVCALGLSEDECRNGGELVTIDGPIFYGFYNCVVSGHFVVDDPDSFDINVRSRTTEPNFLRYRCVGESS